jgi:hypothetical protein
MKISDVTCLKCGSSYLMAESNSMKGFPGREDCLICGNTLAAWSDRQRKSFRLILSPEHKYPPVPQRRTSKKTLRRLQNSVPDSLAAPCWTDANEGESEMRELPHESDTLTASSATILRRKRSPVSGC